MSDSLHTRSFSILLSDYQIRLTALRTRRTRRTGSAESLATRFKREYQRLAEAVFSQGHRSLGALAGETQCDCKTAKRATAKNATLWNTRSTI